MSDGIPTPSTPLPWAMYDTWKPSHPLTTGEDHPMHVRRVGNVQRAAFWGSGGGDILGSEDDFEFLFWSANNARELYEALEAAHAALESDYPAASRAAGNWPTLAPLFAKIEGALEKARGVR